jgi:rod shape-determining protein MreC
VGQPRFVGVILLSALCAAALILSGPLRGGVLRVVRLPFTLVQSALTVLLSLPRLPGLSQENAALRLALTQRQLEVAQLREALRHAQAVSALAEPFTSTSGTIAKVIGRSLLPTQQTLVLSRGSRDGLTPGSVVVDVAGVVGRVTEASSSMALVALLTDPDSRIAGLIERSRETALLVGRGVGQCELIYLDADADVQEGDRVLTAGLGGSVPKGLLLGVVTRVVRDEPTGSAWARVNPAAQLGRVEEVLCLSPAFP